MAHFDFSPSYVHGCFALAIAISFKPMPFVSFRARARTLLYIEVTRGQGDELTSRQTYK